MISDHDLTRYSRQIIIPGFEEEGQEEILSKNILIIGAGGLGCPTALHCAATGFGSIDIWDNDKVELSNLNRQIGHKNSRIGFSKAKSLQESCQEINPNISIFSKNKSFGLKSDIKKYDIIFDCTDNIETRYIINKKCHLEKKILVSGAATQFEGQVSVFKSGVDKNLPCYECVFPKKSLNMPNYNCREAGIIGPVTNFIASLQVIEAIRESLLKLKHNKNNFFFDHSNAGYLFLYDASTHEINKIKSKKNPNCNICK